MDNVYKQYNMCYEGVIVLVLGPGYDFFKGIMEYENRDSG